MISLDGWESFTKISWYTVQHVYRRCPDCSGAGYTTTSWQGQGFALPWWDSALPWYRKCAKCTGAGYVPKE